MSAGQKTLGIIEAYNVFLYCLPPFLNTLVLAALVADGISVIDDIKYIERGYEDFPEKMASLGASMEKVETERDIQKFKLKVG